jgi:hypothetical protein
MRKLSIAALGAFLAVTASSEVLEAQAGRYPAMQPTRVAEREYNFAIADFTGGTALIVQWREGLDASRMQFTGDFGIADGNNNTALIFGGSLHFQLTETTQDFPFEMVVGGGLGVTAADNYRTFRIPFGVAIGHRFPLEKNFAITPFVHPRISLDRTRVDLPGGGTASGSDTNIDIDIGGSFEINTQMQLRMAATLGDRSAVALSFAWLPRGLRR